LTKSHQLAAFSVSVAYGNLPAEVVHCAKRALVDWVAAALAGSHEPAAEKLHGVIMAHDNRGPASIVGTRLSTNAPFAALCNAYASHLLDFDDVYNPSETTIHLGSCIWPVVLAIGQLRKISGQAAIAAYIAGFEAGARVARAAGPLHYESAWHVTGTTGHLASVAAAANALRLSPAAATYAFGIAATQGAGLREVYGSDTKALHPGKAAMDGVLAALLAESGFTSSDRAIEGERGLLNAVSPEPNPDWLTDHLNSEWFVRENGHKLYPTASLTHGAIEAAIKITRRPASDDIVAVEVRMHPFAATVTATAQPRNAAEARFSTPHCVAVALRTGALLPADLNDNAIGSSDISALRARVSLVSDEAMDKRGCRLAVTLKTGEILVSEISRNRGTPASPLLDEDLSGKFSTFGNALLGEAMAADLLARCWDVDHLEAISDLPRMMVPNLALAS
jgi:2-methylcitrate dehydratase PrpD